MLEIVRGDVESVSRPLLRKMNPRLESAHIQLRMNIPAVLRTSLNTSKKRLATTEMTETKLRSGERPLQMMRCEREPELVQVGKGGANETGGLLVPSP